jgi:ATP-dependent Clp protease ATP-binding subunit ClpA
MIENKGITIAIDAPAVAKLAKIGYDPQMGARPMERAIQDKVENLLASKILSNELKKGDSITITANDIV